METHTTPGTTGIALTRARDQWGELRRICVLINGVLVGEVPYGCRAVFPLAPGVYSVSVKMDWNCSPPYEVEVMPGEVIELEAAIRWRGFLTVLSFLAMFFAPRRAFVVHPAPNPLDASPNQERWEGIRADVGFWLFAWLFLFLPLFVIIGLLTS